jgi:large conductance mechanosensitive channel
MLEDILKDFKAFILRGNVVDLAVGVAIGAAFATVIASFTENLLTPLLAIPGDAASLAELDITVSGARFRYGAFLDSVVSFVLVAAVLFVAVVRPINSLMARRKTEPDVASLTKECPECRSSIPVAATRCAFCTTTLPAP